MKTKFLLGTTILLGTSLLPLSVISCSNQVTSSEGDIKPSNSGQDNTNPIPPTDNNPLPPTDNEGENKPSIPGEDNTNPIASTDNGGQEPSQPTIEYHDIIKGYDDIETFIKNNKQIVSNLISQVDETFDSLISHEWVNQPKIIFGNTKIRPNIKDGYIYIDMSGISFSLTTPATLKYKYFDKQKKQKESSISVQGKSVNIELHFRSKTDFIDSLPSVPQPVAGYDDIETFIKNNTEIISNLILQVDETFDSLISHEWVNQPKIIFGNTKIRPNKKDGYIYIDMSGFSFSELTPATLKCKYIDNQGVQKESSISVQGKSVNIELHFKSKENFIGGIF